MGPDTSSNAGRQRHRTDAARGGLADESATLAKLRPGTVQGHSAQRAGRDGAQHPSPKRKVVTVKRGKLTKVTVRYSTSVGPPHWPTASAQQSATLAAKARTGSLASASRDYPAAWSQRSR